MADDTKTVTVKILGDATEFQKSVKEATKVSTDLNDLTSQFRKSGLKEHKALSKVMDKHNKSQGMGGKQALQVEQNLKKQMKQVIDLMAEKQKKAKGNVKVIEEEIQQLNKLKKAYDEVHKHRKMTGTKSGSERAAGIGKSVGGAALGVGALGASLVASVAGALVNLLASNIQQGYASYVNYGRARAGLSGMGSIKGELGLVKGQYGATTGVFKQAEELGFSATETIGQMRQVGQQTGNINAVNTAQKYARMFGGDVGEVAGFMGVMTRGGQGFGGQAGIKGEKQLQRIMQNATTAGMDKSRAGEHLSAVAQAVQAAQTVTGGSVDAQAISSMLTMLGRSGFAGLQGQAGLTQMMKIDSALKGAGFGGGGDAATAMAYQAMDFGTPGGTTSFYEATRSLQRGISDPENVMKYLNRFAQEGGWGSEQATLSMSRATGMSIDVVEKLWQAASKGGSSDIMKEIADITKESLPTDQQIRDYAKEHLEVAKRVAYLDNRLVGIGATAAEGIEKLEDVWNDIADTFMQDAVRWLEVIADVVKHIWEGIKPFFTDYNKDSEAAKTLEETAKQEATIFEEVKAGKITGAEAAKRLKSLKSGTSEISEGNAVEDYLLGWAHLYHRGAQAMGVRGWNEESTLQSRNRMLNEGRTREMRRNQIAGYMARGMSFEEASVSADIAQARGALGSMTGSAGYSRATDPDNQMRVDYWNRRLEALEARLAEMRGGGTQNPHIQSSTDPAALRASGAPVAGGQVTTTGTTTGGQ